MTSLGPNELIIYDMSCYLYPAVMIIIMIDYTFSNNFSYSFWHFLLDFSEFHSVELVLYIELNRIDSITGPVEPPYTLRNTQVLGPVPCKKKKSLNSLGPSDAIWRWRSWSTLVQVMACCPTAPSHYLNQC